MPYDYFHDHQQLCELARQPSHVETRHPSTDLTWRERLPLPNLSTKQNDLGKPLQGAVCEIQESPTRSVGTVLCDIREPPRRHGVAVSGLVPHRQTRIHGRARWGNHGMVTSYATPIM
jgi:hypothetical protein